MIIDREEYLESSVKTRPIHTAAIPKHTKEKPIIKEMNEDEKAQYFHNRYQDPEKYRPGSAGL